MGKREEIIEAAKHRARSGGYSNFSFRELAKETGIKSASVHYHFPTKADLGAALAQNYTEHFMAALGEPADLASKGLSPIGHYIEQFRKALLVDRKMCLCGLFGAEIDMLPELVQAKTKEFFRLNLAWLESAYGEHQQLPPTKAKVAAARLLAGLEGALILSKTLNDDSLFELAIEEQ